MCYFKRLFRWLLFFFCPLMPFKLARLISRQCHAIEDQTFKQMYCIPHKSHVSETDFAQALKYVIISLHILELAKQNVS